METLLIGLYTLIFVFIIKKSSFFKLTGISIWLIITFFILKIITGIGVFLIYSKYYQSRNDADIFRYFDDGLILFSSIFDNPIDFLRMLTGFGDESPHLYKYYEQMGFWIKPFDYDLYNDNRTVIRFNAIVRLFSFGYFNVHTVFINFLSFSGLIAIYRAFEPWFTNKKHELLFILMLTPTLLFWMSGVLKEGILIFAFGFFLYFFFKLVNKFSIWNLIFMHLAIILLMYSKFYILFAVLPASFSIYLIHRFKIKKWIAFSLIHSIVLLFFFNSSLISSYDLPGIISAKQHDFITMVDSSQSAVSNIQLNQLEPNLLSFIKNTPSALINTVARPFISDINSLIMWPAFIENTFIFFIIAFSLIFFSTNEWKEKKHIFWFFISYVVILYVLIGLTTPNIGALVRYKAPAIPFLIMAFVMIYDKNKFLKIFKIKRNV